MTITRERLINASKIAHELNKSRDGSILSDFASSLQKWGELTRNQTSYATALLERYEGESLEAIQAERERVKSLWDNKDADFLDLLDFVCFFFRSDNCHRYQLHMQARKTPAERVKLCLDAHRKGGVPFPSKDVSTLMNSKLWEKLSIIKTSEPKYQVGDLISIRGRGQYFDAWSAKEDARFGAGRRYIRESFQICIITEVVNGTYRCNNPHPTKGTCRLYKIKAFSGGQSLEILMEEDAIKPMK